MSLIPEFIEPIAEPSKKPNPTAGLGEYLQNQLGETLGNIKAVETIDKFFSYLHEHPNAIVWLDLEIDPNTEMLIDGAMVIDNQFWYFTQETFAKFAHDIYRVLNHAHFLGGHNLVEFDLPRLLGFFQQANIAVPPETLNQWQAKTWDTLILSCLLIPHQPTHALAKLYKADTHRNNPIQDCLEAAAVFRLCQTAWRQLTTDMQVLFGQILPPLRPLNEQSNNQFFAIDSDCIFDWDNISTAFPAGNHQALLTLLKYAFHHSEGYDNLGLACFVNWLRYFAKPQARRPVWISKHPIYKQSFQHAEDTFWQIHEPNEDWINSQCKAFFGFDSLRDGQMAIVKATLGNQDIPLGILATGGGKSLAFQLPALIFSKYQRQLTVVISPLKALIEDQVINLHAQLPDRKSVV